LADELESWLVDETSACSAGWPVQWAVDESLEERAKANSGLGLLGRLQVIEGGPEEG